MTFAFSDEQQELRRGVRRFLEDKSPARQVRRLMETDEGYDRAVWSQMAQQLGLQGLTIPEEHGGAGGGPVEQLVVLEEMGRVLLCAPYFATAVLAVNALRASGDASAQRDILPGIAAGTTIATLAVPEDAGSWSTAGLQTRARRAGDAYVIDGRKSFVLDGAIADLVLLVAQSDDGPTLFAVDGGARGLSRRPLQTIDMTRKQAALELAGVPARRVGSAGAAARIVEKTLQLATVALAAEQVGGAQRCLDMSVEYAKLRVQFGRPIGSFQALKHRMADLYVAVQSARAVVNDAIAEPSQTSTALARVAASEAFSKVAAEAVQMHGGIAITWEHDIQLYFKRAHGSAQLLGPPRDHLRRLESEVF